jgi:NADPH:quinone reductase-like Zn-dependent oxidoreductase
MDILKTSGWIIAVQLGAFAGARVTGTVRNEELRPKVAELGAEAIDPEGFEETGPYDVVLELVGGGNLPGNLKALATGGRITVIGVGGTGPKAELNLLALMQKRGAIRASTLRARPLEEKAEVARLVEKHVLPGFDSGALRVPIADSFDLERAGDAYERFTTGGKLGKVVITFGG